MQNHILWKPRDNINWLLDRSVGPMFCLMISMTLSDQETGEGRSDDVVGPFRNVLWSLPRKLTAYILGTVP
jgi:hypothetical protein